MGIYKPLTNKVFDKLIKTSRTKFGAIAVTMEESIRYILKTQEKCQKGLKEGFFFNAPFGGGTRPLVGGGGHFWP